MFVLYKKKSFFKFNNFINNIIEDAKIYTTKGFNLFYFPPLFVVNDFMGRIYLFFFLAPLSFSFVVNDLK